MRINSILLIFALFLYFVMITTLTIGIFGLLGIHPFKRVQTLLGILFVAPSSLAITFLSVYIYKQIIDSKKQSLDH